MKLAKNKARRFSWSGINGWAYSSENFPMSCAYIAVSGAHGKIKNKGSNRLYFVISGAGRFEAKNEILKVKSGDVVMIPKGMPYDYSGKMKLLLVDSPAFNPKSEIKL